MFTRVRVWQAAGREVTPLTPSNLWRSYTALLRRAGLAEPCEACKGVGRIGEGKKAPKCEACDGHRVIARFRFHDLRHTYAALAFMAKVDIHTLSKRMGHSSIAVTADRYEHLYTGDDDDAQAIDRLMRLLRIRASPTITLTDHLVAHAIVLQKPFTHRDLAQLVRSVLDQEG